MISRVRLKDGRVATLHTSEVVSYDDNDNPVAVTYEENGLIMHSDASHRDFSRVCRRLGIDPPEVDVIKK